MKLQDLERRFVASLALPVLDPLLLNQLDSTNLQSDRLNIYRRNVNFTLIKTLKTLYPVVHRLVGDYFFEKMAYEFLRIEYSESFSLNHFGSNFSDFISQFPPVVDLPYLQEIARLEWIFHQVEFGPVNSRFDFKALSLVVHQHYENIIFLLAENAHLFQSNFPVDIIWKANQKENQEVPTIDINQSPGCQLLIIRKEFEVLMIGLTPLQWEILSHFQQGFTLGQFAKTQFSTASNSGKEKNKEESQQLLMDLIERGYITRFKLLADDCKMNH